MTFDWVLAKDYRDLIESDYREALTCLKHGAVKACQIVCGSVMEAALSYALWVARVEFSERVSLHQLIELCTKHDLLRESEVHCGRAIKDWRNLVHPLKSLRERRKITARSAAMALHACEYMLGELQKTLDGYLPPTEEAVLLTEDGKRVALCITPFSLGRGEGNSLVIGDERVSLEHVRVFYRDGAFYLEDSDSKNGTYLCRKGKWRKVNKARLSSGDKFRLGKQKNAPQFDFALEGRTLTC